MSMASEALKQKTTWTGIIGIIGSVGAAMTGATDWITAIQTALPCLIGIFLRQGIAKAANGG